MKKHRHAVIENQIKNLLLLLGEDVERDGLKETPKRVSAMYQELLQGYSTSPKSVFKLFESNNYDGLITVHGIDFYSLCEHHLVPFFGQVHIGYIPNGKILGLSKFARLVDVYARRLQVQEHLTTQIADAIMEYLQPKGVIVFALAEHLCMSMRGVKKKGTITKTLVMKGIFKEDKQLFDQFYKQIEPGGKGGF
jgi:GTP cyclohydrolase I